MPTVVVTWLRVSLPNRRTWGAAFLQADGVRIDGWVVGFAVLAALLVGGLFGLIPAVRASNPNLDEALKDAAPGMTGTARGRRTWECPDIGAGGACRSSLPPGPDSSFEAHWPHPRYGPRL